VVEDHLLACETGLEANQVAFWQQKRSRMLFCNILLTPPSPGATPIDQRLRSDKNAIGVAELSVA